MSLLPAIEEALVDLAGRLSAAGIEFHLGGSAMLRLLGADVAVNDLDVVCRPESLERLIASLPGMEVVERSGSGVWASEWLGRVETNGVAVDLVGGLALRLGGRVEALPFAPGPQVEVRGVRVVLASPRQWALVYRVSGRPEKAELAERLAAQSAGGGR